MPRRQSPAGKMPVVAPDYTHVMHAEPDLAIPRLHRQTVAPFQEDVLAVGLAFFRKKLKRLLVMGVPCKGGCGFFACQTGQPTIVAWPLRGLVDVRDLVPTKRDPLLRRSFVLLESLFLLVWSQPRPWQCNHSGRFSSFRGCLHRRLGQTMVCMMGICWLPTKACEVRCLVVSVAR